MQEGPSSSAEQLLRLTAVEGQTGLKKSAIYQRMKAGTFPACVKVGKVATWPASEINQWIAERIRASRGGR